MSNDYTDGLQVIFNNMERHYNELYLEIDAAVQGAGIETEALAKKACPVGTPESTGIKGYKGGRLRSSIQYQRKGPRACRVWTNVSYAVFVELGTTRMRARPYLFPAYVAASRHLLEELKSIGVGK